jgi:GT2 family glycosyltransferase
MVTYNGMRWLPETMLQIPPAVKVVVVDNASGDETVTFLTKNFPAVTVLPQAENLGFGRANNIGIAHAMQSGARWFFLLNQDAYLEPGCLGILQETARRHPEYGVLSPLHFSGEGSLLDRFFSGYIAPDRNLAMTSDAFRGRLGDVYEFPFVNAAAWLLSADARRIGGFDPIFFHYGEDDNFCQRIRYHGLKVGVVPAAKVRHDRRQEDCARPGVSSKDYPRFTERLLKIRFADINRPFLVANYFLYIPRRIASDLIDDIGARRLGGEQICLLRLIWSALHAAIKSVNTTMRCWSQIRGSRSINVKTGGHYL